jgi:hypothetical protein
MFQIFNESFFLTTNMLLKNVFWPTRVDSGDHPDLSIVDGLVLVYLNLNLDAVKCT